MNNLGVRILRRVIASVAVLLVFIGLFYAEELWRGKNAWEKCRQELQAQGAKLNWNDYIPAPVADNDNVFAAPQMQKWFSGVSGGELYSHMWPSKLPDVTKLTADTAAGFLRTNSKVDPDLEMIRQALRRPASRLNGNYATPAQAPIPNILGEYALVRTLSVRTKCHLLLGQPDAAVDDLTFKDNASRAILEDQKPISLFAAWLIIQTRSSCADQITEGIRSNSWNDAQLAKLEELLKRGNLLLPVQQAFEFEREVLYYDAKPQSLVELTRKNFFIDRQHLKEGWWNYRLARIIPTGWAYQGLADCVQIDSRIIAGMHPDGQIVFPEKLSAAGRDFDRLSPHWAPKAFVGRYILFDVNRVCQTTAYFQTKANETLVACALERYRMAHGEYPETLDALAPRFIDEIPHDIIGGAPLHYRRAEGNTFVLYSVGWNGRDDGGRRGSETYPFANGDWVW